MKTPGVEQIRSLDNFGHSLKRSSYFVEAQNAAQIEAIFDFCNQEGKKLAFRGTGLSYGDAALNGGHTMLGFSQMNKITSWDAKNGIIEMQPGVTIEQLWQHVLGDGWWPPVVPGTMFPTIGGCLAANIHGKNNWVAGTLGEHVLTFDAILPNGKSITCTPKKNRDFFEAMIGGMGMLGVFTSIKLQLKAIQSGDLSVLAWAKGDLAGMLESVDGNKTADYVVGWLDVSAGGNKLGRGQIHRAEYLLAREDEDPSRSLRIDHQRLPDRMLGFFPKSLLHHFMRPFTNNFGTRFVNMGKYWLSRTYENQSRFTESLVAFSFLLDYVPNWERAYGQGGLIQYQSFLPRENAESAYRSILRLSQKRGIPAYLGVLKRHRPDRFLLSHAVDGFSLALDFRVTRSNKQDLQKLLLDMDKIVLEAGGRFYFAKDSTINADKVISYLGADAVDSFNKLKRKADPKNILQSDLYRRCFVNGGS